MEKREASNQVVQSSNDVTNGDIVGGDKEIFNQSGTIVNIFASGPLEKESLVNFLSSYSGRSKEFIRKFIELSKSRMHPTQSMDQNLLFLELLDASNLGNSGDDIKKEYDNIVLGNKMESNDEKIEYKIRDAARLVNNLEFDKAHQLFSDSLKLIGPTHPLYDFLYKEYLISGFILYSRSNDIDGLKSLLRKKAEVSNDENANTSYIISMIFQEIFARDTELKSLREVILTLEKIYASVSDVIKPAMGNSLGLAYRRLGERTDIFYLEKAISIFKEGLELNKDDRKIEIEIKDQMAAAHVRIFEFSKEKEQLDIAEVLLKQCLELIEGHMDPRDYRLKPRILNNIGNVYKQRVLIFKEIGSAAKAMACYEEAEQYWNEKDAGYDWALLRKNLAETKYALGRIINDTELLLEALKDSIRSMKYRNLRNSPYQWGKTVKIVFLVVIFLDEIKRKRPIPKAIRTKILSYINTILGDESRWRENISAEFIQNARQAQDIILKVDSL